MYVTIGFAHCCIFCSPTYTGNKKSRGGYTSIRGFKEIHLYSNGMIISETGKAILHSVLLTTSSYSSPPPPLPPLSPFLHNIVYTPFYLFLSCLSFHVFTSSCCFPCLAVGPHKNVSTTMGGESKGGTL